MESDRASRQNAHSRVVIGNSRDASNSQSLDQRLEREKIKSLIFLHRTAGRSTELMAVEVRNRLVFWIEEILRVERRVAVKLEPGPVHGIGARPCHRVDDASGRSSEFGRVRVCEHLKFKNRFDTEQY